MDNHGKSAFKTFLITISILTGIALTVTLIILIWVGYEKFGSTGAKLIGTEAVVLAAALLNWAVNAIFASRRSKLFPTICYWTTIACIYLGMALSLVTMWADTGADLMLKGFATLCVLFIASLVALGITSIFVSSPPPTAPPPRSAQ